MVTDLAALVGESYERAYTDMVRVQQLTELEEVIAYKGAVERRAGAEGRTGEQAAGCMSKAPSSNTLCVLQAMSMLKWALATGPLWTNIAPHGACGPAAPRPPPVDPPGAEARIVFIQQLWRDRLRGVQRHVEVWQSLFSIRSLVVPMAQVSPM